MQIHRLPKNLYKLYSLVASEKIKTDYEKLCEKQVKQWKLFHSNGISNKKKLWSLLESAEQTIIGERSGLSCQFTEPKDLKT